MSDLPEATSPAVKEPVWEEGEPANLPAAALDALAWLEWLERAIGRGLYLAPEDRPRLQGAIAAIKKFTPTI